MLTHPKRNLLTRAVGVNSILAVDSGQLEVAPGDRIVLCTDGLTGYVNDYEIEQVLNETSDNNTAVNTLMNRVYDLGASDNVTIIVGTI